MDTILTAAAPGSRWDHRTLTSFPWRRRGRVQYGAKIYRRLETAQRWLSTAIGHREKHAPLRLHDIRSLTGWIGNAESSRFEQPNPKHRYFVAFESAAINNAYDGLLGKLGVPTVNEPLRHRWTRLHRWTPRRDENDGDTVPPPYRRKPISLPATEAQTLWIGLAIRRLLRWLSTKSSACHKLHWIDLRGLRPEDYSHQKICPVCIAFSLWCQSITLKYNNPRVASTSGHVELCRVTRYEHFPLTSEGIFVQDQNNTKYRTSADFDRWMFIRSSEYLFLELYDVALWFLSRVESGSLMYSKTIYSSTHIYQRPAYASQIMGSQSVDDGLKVSYWFKSPLREISMTIPARERIEVCQCSSYSEKYSAVWRAPRNPRDLHFQDVQGLFLKASENFHSHTVGFPWKPHSWSLNGREAHLSTDSTVLR